MSDESAEAFDKRLSEILRLIKEVAGEHCDSFVFIANVKEEYGENSRTISSWDGSFNEAVGMTMRMQERLRQDIISTDFPDDPPGGEEWKEENA